ncbi:hypothetical protein P7K49_033672 [Saguinus oedipus]|uniref:Uncharacterized protein n=1 Tax=Saguinus oedipus TaxID=9490 RepID=A0ABQ9TTE4_SAGOE|nr:hypothetical protein P7K49_033672 [Saguinus oedipus]
MVDEFLGPKPKRVSLPGSQQVTVSASPYLYVLSVVRWCGSQVAHRGVGTSGWGSQGQMVLGGSRPAFPLCCVSEDSPIGPTGPGHPTLAVPPQVDTLGNSAQPWAAGSCHLVQVVAVSRLPSSPFWQAPRATAVPRALKPSLSLVEGSSHPCIPSRPMTASQGNLNLPRCVPGHSEPKATRTGSGAILEAWSHPTPRAPGETQLWSRPTAAMMSLTFLTYCLPPSTLADPAVSLQSLFPKPGAIEF